ncbi:MAG: zf-HC2 domain-containing protein [Acidobacteriota bacterium]
MKACLKTQYQFVEALYGELPSARQEEFERHLGSCPACQAQFSSLRATLDFMGRRERSEPDAALWSDFPRQIQQRTAESESRLGARVLSFWRRTSPAAVPSAGTLPKWAWRAAAVLALLAIGILIGRLSWSPPEVQQAEAPPIPALGAEEPPIDQRVSSYMERSKVLLLGIVNIDPSDNGAEALDLQPQKRVSRQLVEEAPGLKQELARSNQDRLLELVSELEMILLQIANLEAQQDLEGVEVIRDGVQRRGLLLRIQLEKSKKPSPKTGPQRRRDI